MKITIKTKRCQMNKTQSHLSTVGRKNQKQLHKVAKQGKSSCTNFLHTKEDRKAGKEKRKQRDEGKEMLVKESQRE